MVADNSRTLRTSFINFLHMEKYLQYIFEIMLCDRKIIHYRMFQICVRCVREATAKTSALLLAPYGEAKGFANSLSKLIFLLTKPFRKIFRFIVRNVFFYLINSRFQHKVGGVA